MTGSVLGVVCRRCVILWIQLFKPVGQTPPAAQSSKCLLSWILYSCSLYTYIYFFVLFSFESDLKRISWVNLFKMCQRIQKGDFFKCNVQLLWHYCSKVQSCPPCHVKGFPASFCLIHPSVAFYRRSKVVSVTTLELKCQIMNILLIFFSNFCGFYWSETRRRFVGMRFLNLILKISIRFGVLNQSEG